MIITDVKLALRITTSSFDSELNDLIAAAAADMELAGVNITDNTDPLVKRAIITYCKVHFGEPDEAERLKRSYDEQKAQLKTATGYADWS